MKRIISLVLVLVMAAMTLTACQTPSTTIPTGSTVPTGSVSGTETGSAGTSDPTEPARELTSLEKSFNAVFGGLVPEELATIMSAAAAKAEFSFKPTDMDAPFTEIAGTVVYANNGMNGEFNVVTPEQTVAGQLFVGTDLKAAFNLNMIGTEWYGVDFTNIIKDLEGSAFAPGKGDLSMGEDAYAEIMATLQQYMAMLEGAMTPPTTTEINESTKKAVAAITEFITKVFANVKPLTGEDTSLGYTATKTVYVINNETVSTMLGDLVKLLENNDVKEFIAGLLAQVGSNMPEGGEALEGITPETLAEMIGGLIPQLKATAFELTFTTYEAGEFVTKLVVDISVDARLFEGESEEDDMPSVSPMADGEEAPATGALMVDVAEISVDFGAKPSPATGVSLVVTAAGQKVAEFSVKTVTEGKTSTTSFVASTGEDVITMAFSHNSETGEFKLSNSVAETEMFSVTGTFLVKDNSIEFAIKTIMAMSSIFNEETGEVTLVPSETNLNLSFKVTVGEFTVTAPEFKNILKMTDAELQQLMNKLNGADAQ